VKPLDRTETENPSGKRSLGKRSFTPHYGIIRGMGRKLKRIMSGGVAVLLLLACAAGGQMLLRARRPDSAPALAEGALAALGGLRSLAAEIVWFRADRLQDEGRYVEMAQLASVLAFLEPHTPEVWSYAAWNLAYNVSVMMPDDESRWRWVEAAIRLLRDEGLRLNPRSPALLRELAWLFELKIGLDLDSAAATYRARWREKVEDVRRRGAWPELGMDADEMARIERATGFDDWGDPFLSAIYWAAKGGLHDVVEQSAILYRKGHPKPAP